MLYNLVRGPQVCQLFSCYVSPSINKVLTYLLTVYTTTIKVTMTRTCKSTSSFESGDGIVKACCCTLVWQNSLAVNNERRKFSKSPQFPDALSMKKSAGTGSLISFWRVFNLAD